MKKIFTYILVVLSIFSMHSQTAPNFTVTDYNGVEHRLYEDHLNQGQTVVIELFFVNCPPCQFAAPNVQQMYEDWGSGEHDVEFIKLSTQNGDSNSDVQQFANTYGTSFPGVGFDGGAADARSPYRNGDFGSYFGTPYFAVIAPDGTVNGGLNLSNLEAAIAATGATGGQIVEPDPYTTFNISYTTDSNTIPENVEYILTNGDETTVYNITNITSGTNSFNYPSEDFPSLVNPKIKIEATGPALTNSVKPSDLLTIIKHILLLELITEPGRLLAADVNDDQDIDGKDLLNIQKVILGLNADFPGGHPSWKALESEIELVPDTGNTVQINFNLVKIGDASN